MQPARGRQAQTRTGAAEWYAFVGDHAEVAMARDFITHRRGIHRGVGLQVLVPLANQAEQLLKADELLQERV
ncbi:hypothetical protein D3C87_2064710 [compost metagenome]